MLKKINIKYEKNSFELSEEQDGPESTYRLLIVNNDWVENYPVIGRTLEFGVGVKVYFPRKDTHENIKWEYKGSVRNVGFALMLLVSKWTFDNLEVQNESNSN